MEWFYSEYFQYLLLLPLAVAIYCIRSYWRQKNIQKWLGKQQSFVLSISPFKRHFKMGLSILALGFFILALARPQGLGKKENIKKSGVQIVLAIDISQSMLAEDIKPNRLEFVKKEISRFINILEGNQIALIAFAGSSILVSPFTNDLSALKLYINDLSPDYLSQTGTNFGLLFSKARDVFKRLKTKKNQSVTKVLIIASDGEDHSKNIKHRVKKTTENNIRIFTLSVGTKEGGVIPIKDQRLGQVIEYKKDRSQEVVVSRLNPKTLKEYARLSKGAYYHMSYNQDISPLLKKDLDKLEKTVFKQSSVIQRTEYYQWFLLLGLVLALLELLMGDRLYVASSKRK